MLEPVCGPHKPITVSRREIRGALRRTGAALAAWTDNWDTPECQWWWVCCDDTEYDISRIRSKRRRGEIRRSLKRCEVRRVEAEWFAEHGYPVYLAAHGRYGQDVRPVSAEEFARNALHNAEYAGRETWGAFVEGQLAAYLSCIIIDDMVSLSSSKSDPERLNARPNTALTYTLTHHYLRERGFGFTTCGSRVLLHHTNVQDFRESLGYRRIYCPLRAMLCPALAFAVGTGVQNWGRYLGLGRILSGPMNKLRAVGSLVRIAQACKNINAAAPAPPEKAG